MKPRRRSSSCTYRSPYWHPRPKCARPDTDLRSARASNPAAITNTSKYLRAKRRLRRCRQTEPMRNVASKANRTFSRKPTITCNNCNSSNSSCSSNSNNRLGFPTSRRSRRTTSRIRRWTGSTSLRSNNNRRLSTVRPQTMSPVSRA